LNRKLSFPTSCLFELALLVVAVLWGWLFHRPALTDVQLSLKSVLIGTVAAIPPFVFFLWTLNSKLRLCANHQHLFESLLRPLLGRWWILQLFTISLIAGVSEEAFFRGAIQGSLADRGNVIVAVVLASGLFGACHLLSWTYAIIATLIGAHPRVQHTPLYRLWLYC
jgi:membrane protease YdiL (CAAX protease family)